MGEGRHRGWQDDAQPCDDPWPADLTRLRSRIMYIEDKSGGLEGPARIGRVFFSRSGKTLYYGGRRFRSLKGSGFKANFLAPRRFLWVLPGRRLLGAGVGSGEW